MGVKVALIGMGRMGSIHLKELVRLRNEGLIDSITVIDIDDSRLNAAKSMGVDETFKSIDEALTKHHEAIIIATPTTTHYDLSIKLVGKAHLMVEKPVTVKLSEALNLLSESRKTGNMVIPAMVERFNETAEEAFSMVKEPIALSMVRIGTMPQNPDSYIGVMYDLAIHDLDLALFRLRPMKAIVVKSMLNRDNVSLLLNLDGVSVNIEAKWVKSGKLRVHTYVGLSTFTVADLMHGLIYGNGEVKKVNQSEEPVYLEDRNFLEAVMGKTKPFATLTDYISCLRIIEAIQQNYNAVPL
ncbi:Gfo/Idh/MocA family protein [Caldivirga maquilingensis]|uniref:Oxidoreductase domain protein n=1 Tax=Caldivirga maquilingensis (strain ATCC 700844 / DSM 13496 / JCM 10307 / IC-167) TaxID=397948 RepID=A8MD83_CALMQ|nr:Gfo/Idh/MocA family oxidoreductase [Caldivirga maquilingensis]ABW01739.1 oxidoreductase domain protein [Caldivirga maquilingensis IC-167]